MPKLASVFGAYLAINNMALSLADLKSKVKVKQFENTSSTTLELQTLLWAMEDVFLLHTEKTMGISRDTVKVMLIAYFLWLIRLRDLLCASLIAKFPSCLVRALMATVETFMQIKIVILLASLLVIGCGNVGQHSLLEKSIPESLNGVKLAVNVTDTVVNDPAIQFHKRQGQGRIYFSEGELFYDATALNGWHFAIDYSIEKINENSLVISTHLPASRANSDFLTFRQTLLFNNNTNSSAGDTIIEFYDKEQLVFVHKGTFILNARSFAMISNGLKDRSFSFQVDAINKESRFPALANGDKIQARFLSDKALTFSVNGVEYSGKNQHLEQGTTSKVSLRGVLGSNSTPYEINLNYYDFTSGSFELNLPDNNTKLSGTFETHRYTAVSSSPLKGEVITGNALHSQHTGIIYPYDIYLPPGYTTAKRDYPVVYVTDGQWEKDLANIMDSHKKNVIMIFIHQGPDERRLIDYQPAGASAYIKFLKQELVPLIESSYRVNTTRSYFGASLGGLLGGVLISQETANKPFFNNYILADGSFWGMTPEVITAEAENYTHDQRLPINILLSGTLYGNAFDVADYEKQLRNRHYKNINIINKTLPYLHDEMTGPTLTMYIDFFD